MAQPTISVGFSGTVLDVQIRDGVLLITFAVDRVWKGEVSKRVVLVRPVLSFPKGRQGETGLLTPFDTGQRYIVLAHRLSSEERTQFGVTDSQTLGTSMCGDGSRLFSVAEEFGEVQEMGPGREPQ